jgi:hypothetical protein
MKKLVVAGCSFTAGQGWVDCNGDPEQSRRLEGKDSPYLWVNLCHDNIEQFQNLELVNIGLGGASNTQIFEKSISALTEYHTDIDTLVVQWTSMPRYTWNVGLELWDTTETLNGNNPRQHDHRLSDGTVYSRKYLQDLRDRLITTHHLHWEILKLLKYATIINRYCDRFDIKCVFINGLCPWDQDYFVRLNNAVPSDYTVFTQTAILNVKDRADDDIFKLYCKIHDDYDHYSIRPDQWVNLYNSFWKNRVDINYDGAHPGIRSNQLFYQQVKGFVRP